jgi:two-component system, LytTR family, response regulator
MKLTCLIVDDEQHALDLLTDYVKQIPYLHLVVSTTDSLLALQFIEDNHIDLVITDLNMPKLSGLGLFEKIKEKVKVIFVTGYSELVTESLGRNAIDFMLKPVSFERFENATYKAFMLTPYQRDFKDKLVEINLHKKLSILTQREKDILVLIGELKENKEIGEKLFISQKTVESHRLNINQKLNLHGRKDLLAFAIESKKYV